MDWAKEKAQEIFGDFSGATLSPPISSAIERAIADAYNRVGFDRYIEKAVRAGIDKCIEVVSMSSADAPLVRELERLTEDEK